MTACVLELLPGSRIPPGEYQYSPLYHAFPNPGNTTKE